MFSKKNFKKQNLLDFFETKCVICNFNIGAAASNGPKATEMTYYDFIVQKEHCFLGNTFHPDTLKKPKSMSNIEAYFFSFEKFLKIIALLENRYTSDSDIGEIDDNCLLKFIHENEIESFRELFLNTFKCKVKNFSTLKKTKLHQIKIISFVYQKIMNFPNDELEVKIFASKKFFVGVLNLLYGDVVTHHSHVNGEIFAYAHDFCNFQDTIILCKIFENRATEMAKKIPYKS